MRMNGKAHGQLRRSQVITTFGPGALIDLPNDSAIVGGLDTWGSESSLEPIDEPRLSAKLMAMTGVPNPRLYAAAAGAGELAGSAARHRRVAVSRVVRGAGVRRRSGRRRPFRLALAAHGSAHRPHQRPLREAPGRRHPVRPRLARRVMSTTSTGTSSSTGRTIPVVGGCGSTSGATSGDLVEQIVRCECGRSRRMHEAVDFASFPLGVCRGARPWLGRHANEECREPSRLLIRTASNAWFPQVVSVLSLPDRGSEVDQVVEALWDRLRIVKDANALAVMKHFPDVANGLAPFSDQEVLDAIAARNAGGAAGDRPIKHAELDGPAGGPGRLRRRRFHPSGLSRAPAAGIGLARFCATRRHRSRHPGAPAAGGAGTRRVHSAGAGDAERGRRVRRRGRACLDRPGAGVVSGGGEPR